MENKTTISMSVVRRLPRYYRFFRDLKNHGVVRISSRELAEKMGLTASQIRQDLNCFGEFGQQGYGYSVERLYEALHRILGFDQHINAILIGAGNLGRAVANHMDFAGKGITLAGVFDDAVALHGTVVAGVPIQPTEQLESFCREEKPTMAILCIPQETAPALSERLIACGVNAFWNFSHYDIALKHPEVQVENVHLGDSLMTLSYLLQAGTNEEMG